jgi:hypothetical protein
LYQEKSGNPALGYCTHIMGKNMTSSQKKWCLKLFSRKNNFFLSLQSLYDNKLCTYRVWRTYTA